MQPPPRPNPTHTKKPINPKKREFTDAFGPGDQRRDLDDKQDTNIEYHHNKHHKDNASEGNDVSVVRHRMQLWRRDADRPSMEVDKDGNLVGNDYAYASPSRHGTEMTESYGGDEGGNKDDD